MPAPISAPIQHKIIEQYENGSKLKDIAQTVAVGRNAVARIVRAYIDKNAAAPKTIDAADFSAMDLYQLKYLLQRLARADDCPMCDKQFVFLQGDTQMKCQSCGKILHLSAKKRV